MKELVKKLKKNWFNLIILFLLVLILFLFLGGVHTSLNSKHLGISRASQGLNGYYDGDFDDSLAQSSNLGMGDLVIKSAYVDLETNSFVESNLDVERIIVNYQAKVLLKNIRDYKQKYKRVNYKIKVRAESLDNFLEDLKQVADLKDLDVEIEDVTKSHTDYSKRLDRYESQIVKYRSMLESNISVEDEIRVQSRIDVLEDSIFSIRNNLERMNDRVEFSVLSLDLREKESVFSQVNFITFKQGFKAFLESLNSALVFIVYVVGFLIPFGLIFAFYKVFRRFV